MANNQDDQSVAVAEPKVKPAKKPATRSKLPQLPPYHVVLLDDNDHTESYVIEMLADLFTYPATTGLEMAYEVNSSGRVIVLTTHKEHAELKRDQILAYGADPRLSKSRGSMSAIIEPADM